MKLALAKRASPRSAVVCALALALTFVSGAAARTHRPGRCSLAGSRTVLATTRARLFTKENSAGGISAYACLYRRNRRFLLSREQPGEDSTFTRLPALVGPYVAYVLAETDSARRGDPSFKGFPDRVVALDLSTGGRRRFRAASGDSPSARVSDLVLSRTGSFAWIGSGPGGNEVHFGTASDTLVDSGPDVVAGSLALSRTAVYWTKGANPMSARIP